MQKHRFNVRLGSVISSGERKKLVWTGRKRVTERRRGGSSVSSSGLTDGGSPADGAVRGGFSPGEIAGPGSSF